jgi:protein-tyrosine phosphatase
MHLPVLVHCTAGKDRTGVIVAALLAALRIPRGANMEEYRLSDGPLYEELLGAMIDSMTCEGFFRPEVMQGLRRWYTEPEPDTPAPPLNADAVL